MPRGGSPLRSIALAATLASVIATAPLSAAADTSETSSLLSPVEAGVLAAINEARREAALPALAPAAPLLRAARAHARDMVRNRFLGHTGSDGADLAQRVDRAGYRWAAIAENVAAGRYSPAEVVRAWMASPGHRRNILDPAVEHAGIAAVASETGIRQPAGRRHWVAVFARAQRYFKPR